MATNVTDAERSILEAIKVTADSIAQGKNYASGSAALRDLAYAYRAVIGGTQPGTVVVSGS